MRKIIVIVIVSAFSLFMVAQEGENALEQLIISDSSYISVKNKELPARKPDVGVDVNMGYMFSSSGFGGPEFSIAPHISYPLSGRFWLNAGIMASNAMYSYPQIENSGFKNQVLPMTRMFLYTSGNYKVSDKLVLTGTAYQLIFENPKTGYQSTFVNNPNRGISVGFNYKIGSNVSIGAQFLINSNDNLYMPFGNNLYPGAGFNNPYYGW